MNLLKCQGALKMVTFTTWKPSPVGGEVFSDVTTTGRHVKDVVNLDKPKWWFNGDLMGIW